MSQLHASARKITFLEHFTDKYRKREPLIRFYRKSKDAVIMPCYLYFIKCTAQTIVLANKSVGAAECKFFNEPLLTCCFLIIQGVHCVRCWFRESMGFNGTQHTSKYCDLSRCPRSEFQSIRHRFIHYKDDDWETYYSSANTFLESLICLVKYYLWMLVRNPAIGQVADFLSIKINNQSKKAVSFDSEA